MSTQKKLEELLFKRTTLQKERASVANTLKDINIQLDEIEKAIEQVSAEITKELEKEDPILNELFATDLPKQTSVLDQQKQQKILESLFE